MVHIDAETYTTPAAYRSNALMAKSFFEVLVFEMQQMKNRGLMNTPRRDHEYSQLGFFTAKATMAFTKATKPLFVCIVPTL